MSIDSSEPSDPRVGRVLDDRYRIIERISEGAMGVVYLAERLKLHRRVAIKFLRAGYAIDDRLRGRFEREARAMSKLEHPHVVSVIDFGVSEGQPYIVMERVIGRDLQDLLETGPVAPGRAIDIARQMLAGLAHAHGQGIIHRDIKPGNVMLTDATGTGDYVRLLDFGLAKLHNPGKTEGDISTANIVVGTPNYMSPEQSLGEEIDERTDVYSTAIVLYELLTGVKPFTDDDTFEILRRHREDPVPRLAEVAPDLVVPDGLEAVLRRALAKKPSKRYQSAIEFADALKQVVDDEVARAPTMLAEGAGSQTMAVSRPRSPLGTVLMLVVLAGVAGAAWYGWQRFGGDSDDGTTAGNHDTRATTAVSGANPADEPALTIDAAPFVYAASADAAPPDGAPADGGVLDAATDEDGGLDDGEGDSDDGDTGEVEEIDAGVDAAPAPAPAAPPPPVTWASAKKLIAAGKREQAIDILRKLKRKDKKSAFFPYVLGNLYFEKNWWVSGIDAYTEAIKNNRGYRRKSKIINNGIRALASNKTRTRKKVYALFINHIGKSARRALQRAAKSDRNPKVRSRAKWLLKRLKR